jgi:hypothetical protein
MNFMNLYFADHPYILAFSLIMLHTDAFNKSNKRKMTKVDYLKNTRLPGVATEVLDVSPCVQIHFDFFTALFFTDLSSVSTTILFSLLSYS